MNHEMTARQIHRGGYSCAASVYKAFSDLHGGDGSVPVPRSDGGKCGAVLSAEKILREYGTGSVEKFDELFIRRFGSLKCGDLLSRGYGCNEYVGHAAALVDELLARTYIIS